MQFAKDILNRERSLMKSTQSYVKRDAKQLNLGIEREKLFEAMGVLRVKDARREFVHDLDFMMEDAGNVSTKILEKRISRIDEMKKEMEYGFEALRRIGHKDFADMMMKSLNFAKQVIGNMIKLKLQIYNEMKMSGDATALGDLAAQQYVSLRQKLLKQAEDQAAMSTEMEAALRKKLQTLGIVGHQSAEHLAAFLHQICFSLANAEQDGLQNLLGDMKKQSLR